jgi:RHS repeat-associated protein
VILHYHPDSVGSTAALTDAEGRLVEERTHYPYGGLRHTHQPGTASGGQDYDFTGKERDRESGLIAMGARGYLDFLGGFLSPDPRFAEAARLAAGSKSDQTSFATFLTNPQMGNLYAYGLRNPLKFVDPDGLDARVAAELWRESYFVEALDKTLRSEEGRYIFNRIQQKGYTVTVEKGDLTEHAKSQGRNYVAGATWSTDSSKTIRIVLDVDNARKFRGESDLAKKAFAKTIHHEFLHALIYRFIDVERRLAAQALVEGRMDDFAQHAALAKYGNELHQRLDRGENESELKFKQQVGLPAGDVEFGKIDLSDITVTPIKPE